MLDVDHLVDIDTLSPEDLETVLDRAEAQKSGADDTQLPQTTMGMLFEKPSTRTRISFETGMTELGGHAIFLGPEDIQLGHGEPLKDTSRVLSRYVDVVMARLFDHADLLEIATYSDVPVVNGLTDEAHPCQTLADLLTIREAFDGFDDVQATWVGDGNNVGQSFVLGCALAGIDLTVCTPPEYGMSDAVLKRADELGHAPEVVEDPVEAVSDADVLYTDVWVSMGQEDRRAEKLAAFDGYQVNMDLLSETDAVVMHCLPAHRGEEITDDVLESDRVLVWDQAENRLHAQKGLLVELME
ncbi:ornithine carbamoyltransferase [Halogranum gelatinilyticum]|uniref:Ornithine carbamoyltransferase n=1 Tax=Halogranum gelatinilyticum TaxID=660521 RepID=A0A1G9NYN0_9EURY|nr:ornithine carbamoyltransferase [Halogranum gelatinilyticum]SDL91678.1 ornithine carbamoyltransferase [Halogranum gelatinilyticum]